MLSAFEIAYNVITPIFLVVGIAALFARRFKPDPAPLSRAVIYLFAPGLVIQGISKSELQGDEILQIVFCVFTLSFILVGIGWAVGQWRNYDPRLASAFTLTIVFMNAANYGIPFNEFAFGTAARDRAILFYISSVVLSYTVGIYLASSSSGSASVAIKNVLTVPLPYATALGFFLKATDSSLPLPIERAVGLLADGAVPGMLVVLGIQLARVSVQRSLRPILLASGLRLLISPLIMVGIVGIIGLSGLSGDVLIMQAAMPSAVITGVLATEFGSDAEFATTTVLVSTLLSMATLSVVLTLLT